MNRGKLRVLVLNANFRFGSLAALKDSTIPMAASGGKADVDNESLSVSESSATPDFSKKNFGKDNFLKLKPRDRQGQ